MKYYKIIFKKNMIHKLYGNFTLLHKKGDVFIKRISESLLNELMTLKRVSTVHRAAQHHHFTTYFRFPEDFDIIEIE